MEQLDRRNLFAALSTFAALGAMAVAADAAEDTTAELSVSKVYHYKDLPVSKEPDGGSIRHVLSGTLPTGEFVEIHESVLPPGKMPHPPHHHPNTEVLFIQQGKLIFLDNGTPRPVGPGDIVFTASNVMHGLKNVGTDDGRYIVVSVGKQLPGG